MKERRAGTGIFAAARIKQSGGRPPDAGRGFWRMKLEWNRKYTTIAVYALLVLCGAILFSWSVSHWGQFFGWIGSLVSPIKPIFYGFAIAYLLNPIMVWFETKAVSRIPIREKRRRVASMLLTYLITFSLLISFMLIIVPQVFISASNLLSKIQAYTAAAEALATDLFSRVPPGLIPDDVVSRITDAAGSMVENLFSWLGASIPVMISWTFGVTSGIIQWIMGIIVSIYLLASKEKFFAQIRKFTCAFFSPGMVHNLQAVTATTHNMFGRFITGKIIDSIIIGILCFIGLSVMKMPNIILVSFIVGVTNVIPYFGPFIGAIPSFFIIAIDSPLQGLVFLFFVLVLQQLDGNVIGPMILGDSTGLSAFWVVFAILFFGGVFGVFGMFIGVPTFGVIYWLFRQTINHKLGQKGYPTETDAYYEPGHPQDRAAKKQDKPDA